MTTEEKAKAYDEALEKAKKYHEEYWQVDAKDVTETLFPQLRESEDERIINQLITLVNSTGEVLLIPTNKEELVDWLKKQKEQKPVDYDHEMWKNCVANFEGGKKEVIEHPERYGLQTPAEWSEEDEKHINLILRVLDIQQCWDGATGKKFNPYQDEIYWLKSLRPRSSWKSSDEQMNCLCAAVDAAIRKHNESVSGYKPARVLKSLYEDLKKL